MSITSKILYLTCCLLFSSDLPCFTGVSWKNLVVIPQKSPTTRLASLQSPPASLHAHIPFAFFEQDTSPHALSVIKAKCSLARSPCPKRSPWPSIHPGRPVLEAQHSENLDRIYTIQAWRGCRTFTKKALDSCSP